MPRFDQDCPMKSGIFSTPKGSEASSAEFFNSCSWSSGPRPGHENAAWVALRWHMDGASVERSAQPGVASPINSWTLGAPWHDRLSLPVGKHVDQTRQLMSTPLGRPDTGGPDHGRYLSPLLRVGRAQA